MSKISFGQGKRRDILKHGGVALRSDGAFQKAPMEMRKLATAMKRLKEDRPDDSIPWQG